MKRFTVPALRLRLPGDRELFAFGVDGKFVPRFAATTRIRRESDGSLGGYQRPEVLSHIAEIRTYIESGAAMIPNAVVVAFDRPLLFTAEAGRHDTPSAESGCLTIDIPTSETEARPGFVVDGQQRLAAIREAEVPGFPIFVVAFHARTLAEQKEQFILVNSTKPLPKGLIYELLPGTDGMLPAALRRRQLPAALLDRLNRDVDSPLFGLIRTPTSPEGVIRDNSLLRALENSLSEGLLYRYRSRDSASDPLVDVIKNFWRAVRRAFPQAWGLPPKRSRLMHGAGILSLSFLMDAIADRHRSESPVTEESFLAGLQHVAPICRWTDGFWDFGPGLHRKWSDLQNTSRDIQLLSNYLLIAYREAGRVSAR